MNTITIPRADLDRLCETLRGVAQWLDQTAAVDSGGPDEPPQPRTEHDYEMLQAASELTMELNAIAAALSAPSPQPSPEPVAQPAPDPLILHGYEAIQLESGGTTLRPTTLTIEQPAQAQEQAEAVSHNPMAKWPFPNVPDITAYQYLFDGPYGEVWRNDPAEWNGQRPKASRPLYAAPQPATVKESLPVEITEQMVEAGARAAFALSTPHKNFDTLIFSERNLVRAYSRACITAALAARKDGVK